MILLANLCLFQTFDVTAVLISTDSGLVRILLSLSGCRDVLDDEVLIDAGLDVDGQRARDGIEVLSTEPIEPQCCLCKGM